MRASVAAFLPLVWACSYVEIPYVTNNFNGSNASSKPPGYMIGRTMELSDMFNATTYKVQAFPATEHGAKYAHVDVVSMFAKPFQMNVTLEGMNEKGLTMSAHALQETAYESHEEGKHSIFYFEVVAAVLAQCDTVDSAVKFLAGVRVVQFPQFPSGLHFAMADAAGRSVVIEYLEGRRVVSENTPRVMTNDPNLQWHWRNLNTWSSLSPKYPTENDFLQVETDVGQVPRGVGHGWNLHGMPGDASPPSRFVRLFYLRGYALQGQGKKAADNFEDAVVLGTALLNNVFIPFGTVAPVPSLPGDTYEYTPYAVLKSPIEKKMLVRGYRNSQWRMFDLNRLDLTREQEWAVDDGHLGILDMSDSGSEDAGVHNLI